MGNLLGLADLWEQEPFMAIIHAFCDESGKHHADAIVSFVALCTPLSRAKTFSDAWEGLLRRHRIKDGFHMVDAIRPGKPLGNIPAQSIEERIEALKPFIDCISQHFEFGFAQGWEVAGWRSWSDLARQAMGSPDNPYYVNFTRGLLEIIKYIHHEDKLSIVCDDDLETAWLCFQHYRAARNIEKKIYRRTMALTFADDRHCLPIQAADMVALLIRHEARYRFFKEDYAFNKLFDYLAIKRTPPSMEFYVNWADRHQLKGISDYWEKDDEQGIPEVRQNDGTAVENVTQRDQGEVGSGESSKEAET